MDKFVFKSVDPEKSQASTTKLTVAASVLLVYRAIPDQGLLWAKQNLQRNLGDGPYHLADLGNFIAAYYKQRIAA